MKDLVSSVIGLVVIAVVLTLFIPPVGLFILGLALPFLLILVPLFLIGTWVIGGVVQVVSWLSGLTIRRQ